MAKKVASENLWDDDFDEADIEESIFKASQVCNVPNVAGKAEVASTLAFEIERQEIQKLLQDPTLLIEDPNIFSADDAFSQLRSHQNNHQKVQPQQQTVQKDDISDNFFDSFDGIDPDLLSSQPIPGTQPRQRWQRCGSGNNLSPNKNPVVAFNQGASTSKAIGVGNANINSRVVSAQIVTNAQNVTAYHTPATSMKPPSSAALSIQHVQANFSKYGQSSSISTKNKLQQSGTFLPQKSIPGTLHDPSTSRHVLSNDAPVFSNGEDIQTIQKKALLQEQELKKKLLQSQQGQSDLEREMMTKKGEISCLRNELQRKTLALDTEKLARLSAADIHKKEMQDRVATATREAQSKSRALEKRLEKLHSDLAFKNREIAELITKCKKMEQLQMHHQKRFQDHLSQQEQMLSQQIASSQEMERQHQLQLMNQTTVLEDRGMPPPFPPSLKTASSTAASKQDRAPCASTSRKFPADRFDFTDREPAAAKQSGSIKKTPTAVAPATVQQQLESLQQEFAAKHLTNELEDAPEDVVIIEGIVVDCQKGFYKASLECIALLDSLSNGDMSHHTTAEESVSLSVSASARERLVLEIVARRTEHHQVVDLNEEYGFTSVIKPRARENADTLLDEDCEGRYCEDYDSWERGTAAVEAMRGAQQEGSSATRRVKEEATVKKETEMQDFSTRRDGDSNRMEVDLDGTEYDEVTGTRIGFGKLFNTAYNRKVEMHSGALSGHEDEGRAWDSGFKWSDVQVVQQAAEEDKSDTYIDMPPYEDVNKTSSDESRSSGESPTAVKHVEALPQEWVMLLSFMAKDDNLCRHEKPEDEDMLSDEELVSDLCGPDFVAGDGLDPEVSNQKLKHRTKKNDLRHTQLGDQGLRHRPDSVKKRRQQLAFAPNLGQFLYDLTQEMLEDNIRDLNSASNNQGIDDEEQDACEVMKDVACDKASVTSQKLKKEGSSKRVSGFSKHSNGGLTASKDIESDDDSGEEDSLLAGIRLHFSEADNLPGKFDFARDRQSSSANTTTNRIDNCTSATRRLFYSVLEWLALEVTYYRNVEKGIVRCRSKERDEAQLAVQKTALTIMEHLLPLRFGCGHLPAPMIVLGYILFPKAVSPQVACTISTSVLSCMRVCASHPSTLMTPEMALLLVDRLYRASRHLSSAMELDSLLQCLEALGQHRIFMQTICGVADECLVGQVCVGLLDLCSEPYTENTFIRRRSHGSAKAGRARPVAVSPPENVLRAPAMELQTDRCLRSFFRWLVSVLLARPAWLLGECQCCLVLLATLLVLTHTEVYQLVKALPMIQAMKESCCAMHQFSSANDRDIKNGAQDTNATCKIKDDLASNKKDGDNAGQRTSRSKTAAASNRTTTGVNVSTTVAGNNYVASSDQTTLVNLSTRSSSIMCSTLLCHSTDGGKTSTVENTNTQQRSRIPPGITTPNASVISCGTNNTVTSRQMTCRFCNTETLCSHACSCSGQCAEFYDESLFDVHARLGCRCKHVWAALRVLKLFLSVDERSTMHTASVPHYTLLAKLLTEALPFFAPLSDPETGKLVSRLH